MKNFFEKAQEKLSDVTESISDIAEIDFMDQAKDYGVDKLNDIWDTINNHSKVINDAGYRINGVNLIISIPPAIGTEFSRIEIVSDEVEKKLLEENKEHKILYGILKALFKANNMLINVRSGGFMFKGLVMTIGASIPKIDLKFIRTDED
jgi:hypothetical protein